MRRHQYRIIIFQREGRRYPRLLVGKKFVGWYDFRRNVWYIRRPYCFFINPDKLPDMAGMRR